MENTKISILPLETLENKTFILDLDDAGFLLPGLELLFKIKEHYPNFKITLFTIPLHYTALEKGNLDKVKEKSYKEWARMVNSYDWIQIAVHGLFHEIGECDTTYDRAISMIKAAENIFKKVGLKYKKIYKAPGWIYSWQFLKALKDRNYIVALNRNYPIEVPDGTKTYYYNWSLEEKIPKFDKVKGHGHISYGKIKNALPDIFSNVLKMPENSNFKFIEEYINFDPNLYTTGLVEPQKGCQGDN